MCKVVDWDARTNISSITFWAQEYRVELVDNHRGEAAAVNRPRGAEEEEVEN